MEDQIDLDFNFFWVNNRTACFEEDRENFALLPINVKQEIMVEYLFIDVINSNYFFLLPTIRADRLFLYDIC